MSSLIWLKSNSPREEIVIGYALQKAPRLEARKRRKPDERKYTGQDHSSCDRRKTAKKALAPNPNPEWTEHEMQSIDEWIARQDARIERSEAIRRLVETGLKVKR